MYVFHKCAYLMTSAESWVVVCCLHGTARMKYVCYIVQAADLFGTLVCLRLDPGRRTGQRGRHAIQLLVI